ncbi:MAG: PP2C family protein-serine/threonine phosphatase [Candidatus Margulisbacteria bacterium]|nr:PP2C family protein-serine/threonine phosphatase [Candidatus Margulisiibacteriota bacterium]
MLIAIIIILLLIISGISGYVVFQFYKKQEFYKKEMAETLKNIKRNELKNTRDLDMARRIQSGLLIANKIQHKNYQLSAVCFPAEKIGGDFFILQKNISNRLDKVENETKGIIHLKNKKDETLNFAIGDVSGHGVASALVMILAKNTLEDLYQKKYSPKKIMQVANKKLIEYTEGSAINFVTAFVAMLDIVNNKLVFSKAGHNSPLLFRKNGEIVSLETEGVFLGMFNSPEFEEKEVTLEKGDKIFLYTDGLNEAKNSKDEMLGTQRLIELIKQNIWLSGENLFQKIMDEIKTFTDKTSLNDDVTMILLEIN